MAASAAAWLMVCDAAPSGRSARPSCGALRLPERGALAAAGAGAAGRPRLRPAIDDLPVAERRAGRRRRHPDPLRRRFQPEIDIRAFTLANPYRVVIDMPQVTFQLPPQGRRRRARPDQGASASAWSCRAARASCIDLAQPGADRQGLRARAANDQPARLVLDLAATDRETFLRTIALDNRRPDGRRKPRARRRRARPPAAIRGRSS